MADAVNLLLYGRHACHLCGVMHQELAPYLQQGRISIELRDVDENESWRETYGLRVPVLTSASGEVICEYHLDSHRLEQWLDSDSIG